MNFLINLAIRLLGQSDPKPFEEGKTYQINDPHATVTTLAQHGVKAHVTRSGRVHIDSISDQYRERTSGIR